MSSDIRIPPSLVYVSTAISKPAEDQPGHGAQTPNEPRGVNRVERLEQNADIGAEQRDHSSRHESPQYKYRPKTTPLAFQAGAVLFQMMETMGGTGTHQQRTVGAYLDTYV